VGVLPRAPGPYCRCRSPAARGRASIYVIYLPLAEYVPTVCPSCDAAAYTDLGLNLGDITASFGDSPEAIPDSETLVRCDECGILYDTGIAGT